MDIIDYRKTKFTRISNSLFSLLEEDISSTDFIVYSFIASKVNNKSQSVKMTNTHIGENVFLSQRTVSKSVRNLKYLGLISVENTYRQDGGRAGNIYRILQT